MRSSSATRKRLPSKPRGAPSQPDSASSPPSGPQPWVPERYQLEAAEFLVSRGCGALFLDPGLRKTSCTLAAVKVLLKKRLARRALVVAPPRVCRSVWPKEAAKWKDFAHLRVVNLHGSKKDDLLEEDADIYCVSFQGLDWLLDVKKTVSERTGKVKVTVDTSKLKRLGVDLLVIDELSKAKSHRSQKHKILVALRDHFKRIYGLTGSPAANGLEDLFGEMLVIDGGYSLGQYITHFRRKYFYQTGYGGFTYELRPGAEKEIYDAVAPFVFRLDEKDLLELPELHHNDIEVELPPEARRVYDELEKKLFTLIDEEGFRAANFAAAMSKCRQVANGALFKNQYVDEEGRLPRGPREWTEVHREKLDVVEELHEELGAHQALVAYYYGHDLARLLELFGPKTPYIGSGISVKKGDAICEEWNRGLVSRLLVNPASVSHGLNLQEGSAWNIVMPALIDDFDVYDQFIRRLRRSGNKAKRVVLHRIIARDTVDEAIVARTDAKGKGQQALFDALRDYTLRRHGRRLGLRKKA